MQVIVEAEDLVLGEMYTMEAFPTGALVGAIRETVDDVIARPHELISKNPIGHGGGLMLSFAPNSADAVVEIKDISTYWLPGNNRHRFFTSGLARVEKAMNRKAREFTTLEGMRDRMGGLYRNLGDNVVRAAGIRRFPRHIEGGKRNRNRRKLVTRKSKKSRSRKQTRKTTTSNA